ncbi:cuticle protein 8 isoform X2 [Hyalella azteca]|uniref:Cuticle protein 8 isoform X2 n=1 Tax=Hyalella azteca TaxID=294128 RepID=A0A8B7P8J0_HYAAZ|nr:cuticle protein 8 isoform X2 [Hyalella azteca]
MNPMNLSRSWLLLLPLVLTVAADTRPYAAANSQRVDDQFEEAKYDFAWGVKDDESGNMFNQVETRDADVTRGAYYVALPDGRLQKVTYYVDGDSGFVAEVTYEGEAQFPQPGEHQQQSYAPQYS